jgi:predicted metalloprotease with PDZ domain
MRFLPVLALPALALLVVSQPALAQPIAVPDCTVDVAVSAGPKLDVTYRCRSAKPITFVADDEMVARHVQDLQDGTGAKVTGSGEGWVVPPVNGLAEVRYRYDLADYARTVNSNSSAVLKGQGALVSLPGWLLAPRGYDNFPVIDIRAHTADGQSFATGLPKVGDAWRLSGTTVGYAGYTAIGKFSLQEIAVPAPGSLRPGQPKKDAVIRLAILDGISDTGRAEIADWVKRTAEAEANYWHGFTAPQLMLGLVPTATRRGVGFGRTEASGGATVMIEIGADVDQRRLFNDWVLVHELIHTAMPYIRGRATWFMEGAATYVEPIIRARAGWKTEEVVWKEWMDNMPQGMGAYAKGLSNASGRENYWSGALFMLMADLGIRRDTNGEKGLEDCLGGTMWSGYESSRNVRLQDYVAACDRVTGTKVVSGLLDKYYATGQPFDLAGFWRDLGVSEVGGHVVLDDAAPMARWRKMIVMGPPGHPPKAVKLPWES